MVKKDNPLETPIIRSHFRPAHHSKTKTKQVRSRNLSKADLAILKRADEIQTGLGDKFPTCLKCLTLSHIVGRSGRCLLPARFCYLHLHRSGNEQTVTLITEGGREYQVTYLHKLGALGAGWKKFCTENKLSLGNVLVFQLIGHFTFKVYIVKTGADKAAPKVRKRAKGPDCIKQTDSCELPIMSVAEHNPKGSVEKMVSYTDLGDSQSEKDGEECALDSDYCHIGFPGFPKPAADFQEVKSIEDFTIVINGMNIDSEVSEQDRAKYYKLCCSQKSYLHSRLLEGINTSQWAAAIVSKTVKIADAIKGCQFSTPKGDYESWDNILNSFELLGLNVGFLRARLQRLMSLAFESEGGEICRKQAESRQMVLEAEENIWSLESDIEMLEEKKRRLEMNKEELVDEIKEQSSIAKKYEDSFQEEVDAEW